MARCLSDWNFFTMGLAEITTRMKIARAKMSDRYKGAGERPTHGSTGPQPQENGWTAIPMSIFFRIHKRRNRFPPYDVKMTGLKVLWRVIPRLFLIWQQRKVSKARQFIDCLPGQDRTNIKCNSSLRSDKYGGDMEHGLKLAVVVGCWRDRYNLILR